MEAGFASVWNRVTGTNTAENELAKLQRWIRDEAEGARSYETLLHGRLPAPAAETLRGILRQQRRQLRQLQTLYYLRTGDTLAVSLPERREMQPWMKALRERYDAALTQAEGYRQAASERRDTAALCAMLAEEKEGQAIRLRQLAERLL